MLTILAIHKDEVDQALVRAEGYLGVGGDTYL